MAEQTHELGGMIDQRVVRNTGCSGGWNRLDVAKHKFDDAIGSELGVGRGSTLKEKKCEWELLMMTNQTQMHHFNHL